MPKSGAMGEMDIGCGTIFTTYDSDKQSKILRKEIELLKEQLAKAKAEIQELQEERHWHVER